MSIWDNIENLSIYSDYLKKYNSTKLELLSKAKDDKLDLILRFNQITGFLISKDSRCYGKHISVTFTGFVALTKDNINDLFERDEIHLKYSLRIYEIDYERTKIHPKPIEQNGKIIAILEPTTLDKCELDFILPLVDSKENLVKNTNRESSFKIDSADNQLFCYTVPIYRLLILVKNNEQTY